jgi:hypothetical protein
MTDPEDDPDLRTIEVMARGDDPVAIGLMGNFDFEQAEATWAKPSDMLRWMKRVLLAAANTLPDDEQSAAEKPPIPEAFTDVLEQVLGIDLPTALPGKTRVSIYLKDGEVIACRLDGGVAAADITPERDMEIISQVIERAGVAIHSKAARRIQVRKGPDGRLEIIP